MGSGSLSAAHAVEMWYSEYHDCTGGASFTDGCPRGNGGAATGHFTAMIWAGVREIGCAFSNSNSPTLVICRYKAGDSVSYDTPNMNCPSNYPNHVFPATVSEEQCEGIVGPPAPPPAPPAPNPPPAPLNPAPDDGALAPAPTPWAHR